MCGGGILELLANLEFDTSLFVRDWWLREFEIVFLIVDCCLRLPSMV